MDELKKAQADFDFAMMEFNNADKEHIEKAIKNLNTSLDNLNEVRKTLGMPNYEI